MPAVDRTTAQGSVCRLHTGHLLDRERRRFSLRQSVGPIITGMLQCGLWTADASQAKGVLDEPTTHDDHGRRAVLAGGASLPYRREPCPAAGEPTALSGALLTIATAARASTATTAPQSTTSRIAWAARCRRPGTGSRRSESAATRTATIIEPATTTTPSRAISTGFMSQEARA